MLANSLHDLRMSVAISLLGSFAKFIFNLCVWHNVLCIDLMCV